jgi:hypothetical protein
MVKYELLRLYPYKGAKPGYHSNADHLAFYEAWASGYRGKRNEARYLYCDVRDGFELGTNSALREKLRQSSEMDASRRFESNYRT